MANKAFSTVVCGVDFSDYSKLVAKQAEAVAKHFGAKLILVHVFNDMSVLHERMYIDIKNDVEKFYKDEIAKTYRTASMSTAPEIVILLGRPFERIIEVAKKNPDPLIVVGHKGQNAVTHFFLGSTAEKLALNSPCPVWIQRGNKIRLPHKILIPCDLNNDRSERALEKLEPFMSSSKTKAELFHVGPHPVPVLDFQTWSKASREMRRYEHERIEKFKKNHRGMKIRVTEGDPVAEIQSHSRKFDLITMAPHQRKGFFSGFGSVTGKVVRSGNTPVLVT